MPMPDKDKNENSKPSGKPYQSKFWENYIEKQKQLKAEGSKNGEKNDSTKKAKNEPSKSKSIPNPFDPKPIKIKPNTKQVSTLEKKQLEYQRKLTNTASLLLLLLKTDKRIQGRDHNLTYVVSMKSREDPNIKKYYVICILLYQCLLGAVGQFTLLI
jgi:hypothetical protein